MIPAGGGTTHDIWLPSFVVMHMDASDHLSNREPLHKQNHLRLWQSGILVMPLNGKRYWALKITGS